MPAPFNTYEENLIAAFRNTPIDEGPKKNRPSTSLGTLLETCVERYHIGRHTPEEKVQENWARIVGPLFAKRCRPERIDASGCLVVQVANATVRRELIFMEDRIMTALRSIEECHHIQRVFFKAGQ